MYIFIEMKGIYKSFEYTTGSYLISLSTVWQPFPSLNSFDGKHYKICYEKIFNFYQKGKELHKRKWRMGFACL